MSQKYSLTPEEVLKVPKVSGVYTVYLDHQFPRLNGETDVIYIGKAENNRLRSRLMSLITGKGRKAFPRFKRIWDIGSLLFSYEVCNDPKAVERTKLTEFEKRHMELPPLNHSGYSYLSHKVNHVTDVNL